MTFGDVMRASFRLKIKKNAGKKAHKIFNAAFDFHIEAAL